MVAEHRRLLTAEQAGEPDLPAGRGQEILATDHEVDPLAEDYIGNLKEVTRLFVEAARQ